MKQPQTLRPLFDSIRFWFDYWILEFFFGPFKTDEYQSFMWDKWGDRYSEAYIKEVYDAGNEKN
jgi:hypothetical protein